MKKIETKLRAVKVYIDYRGIQFGMKMCHANNEKWKTAKDGRNRSTESAKNQNTKKKGK